MRSIGIAAVAAIAITIGLGACTPGGSSSAGPNRTTASGSAGTAAPSASIERSTEVSPMTTTPMSASPSGSTASTFSLTSSAFTDGGAIPREFTCDGANVSPPLAWRDAPGGTIALVLVVDDPDASNFAHWIVLDLTGTSGELPKGVEPSAATPQQGTNSFGKAGWDGPCPPSGTHHYRFTLTALGTKLGLSGHPSADAVRGAISNAGAAVIGTAILTATYTRGS